MKGTLRSVSIIGTGMIRFGKYPDKTVGQIAAPAVLEALAEAGASREQIEAIYCGSMISGTMSGQRVARELGMTGKPVINCENACSSSASAFREAWINVASGFYDMVLVVGVEQLTRLGGGTLPMEIEDIEAASGMVMPGLYAMRARRYMHEYGASEKDLAAVAVKARRHGALNPLAQIQEEVSLEQVLQSRTIAEPLTLMQCCPMGDGAASLVLCATEAASKYCSRPVKVLASELTSGRYMPGFRDMTIPEVTVRGSKEAYEMAGLGPEDIDVAETHDAFSIAEFLYYEALGFCGRGEAAKLLREGATSVGGKIPVNPSGGLLSKGHPVGATGAAQMVEIVRQLQGRCGPRQVEGAKVGLAHVTGGGIYGFDHGACAIHIFAR
ncbi:MAG: thiolase family protein [Betaproteobacteria bacterium]|nr:thiolase family protein [Betaproteobacteria bacterium]